MIEINLLPGPKKKKRGGGGLSLPDFKELAASIKDPLLLGVVGSWVVCGGAVAIIFLSVSSEYNSLQSRRQTLQREARTFSALIAQKRRMERLRDSLIVELDAIRTIDEDRYVWPHILTEITTSLPDFTWLVTVDNLATPPLIDPGDGSVPPPPPTRFSIEGRTSDMQAYTRFVRQLENSPWLSNIQIGATQAVIEDERQVQSFQIQGTFVQADSAFMRLVPVTEVVR